MTSTVLEKTMLIDGNWLPAESGKTFAVHNPATGEQIARVAKADAQDVDRAAPAAGRGASVRV